MPPGALPAQTRLWACRRMTKRRSMRRCRERATYIAVGPIFGTTTKDTGYDARGLSLIRYASGRGKPVVAIGGITLERAASVVAAGATGLAVITDLLVDDPAAQARRMIAAIS